MGCPSSSQTGMPHLAYGRVSYCFAVYDHLMFGGNRRINLQRPALCYRIIIFSCYTAIGVMPGQMTL